MIKTFKDYLKNNEVCWEQYFDKNSQLRYIIITKNPLRDKYYLYDVSQNKRKEIAVSTNPTKLRNKMKWEDVI